MRNGHATGVLNDQNGFLGMGVKWDNKMSFVIFSLVIFLEQDFLLQISVARM